MGRSLGVESRKGSEGRLDAARGEGSVIHQSLEPELTAESAHVARTLKALELLAARPHTRAELADSLGVHPRTVRRLLKRLCAEGYVQSEQGGFVATMKIVVLAGLVSARLDLVGMSRDLIRGVRDATGETAHLCVPTESGVMHLSQAAGRDSRAVCNEPGELVPFHCTAVGKALLAYQPERWDRLFSTDLESFTPQTFVDPALLLKELEVVRKRGYAVDDRENAPQRRCVASPVFEAAGGVVAAIGVSAPARRFNAEAAVRAGLMLREASTNLTTKVSRTPAARGGSE